MFSKYLLLALLCVVHHHSANGIGRIVGGQETTIEKRPYQASIQIHIAVFVAHLCGASIISQKFLLTAAHCDPKEPYYIRVGSTEYFRGGKLYEGGPFITHPDYVEDILDYDFAIVTLQFDEIELGPNVAIVPLANFSNPQDGSWVAVSGWGVTNETANILSPILREVDLPVVNADVCKGTYDFLTDRQICLGGTAQGMLSACNGDSGSPAVQNGIQYAVVSGGLSCEQPFIPGIYAKVTSARSWIANITGV